MMGYKEYIGTDITKELLNDIQVGTMVKCNDWKNGMRVCGVSENYFLMARKMFGKTLYSICDKNILPVGKFQIGVDNLIFGHYCGYEFDKQENVDCYLNDLETGVMEISGRNYALLENISIKQK